MVCVRRFKFGIKMMRVSLLLFCFVLFSFNAYGAYFVGLTSPPRVDKVLKDEAKKFASSSLKAYRVSADKLAVNEVKALEGYSAADGTYRLFNERYRDRVTFDKKYADAYVGVKRFSEIVKEQVGTFSSGVAKLPRYSGRVYRGAQLQEKLVSELNVGDVVYEPGFMSTSILPEVAQRFAKDTKVGTGFTKALFEIDLVQGGAALAGISKIPSEAEVLVRPKTYMRVKAIASTGDTKLIALEGVASLSEHQYAYNLYTAERELTEVPFDPLALHKVCIP